MTSTFSTYSIVSRDVARSLERVRSQSSIQREINYFKQAISKAKTVDDFVSDRRLLEFGMTAFGLKDMAYAKAFVRKILVEGRDGSSAFVNKLADKRYLDFAKTFDFKRYGAATTMFDSVQIGVVEKYVRQALESQSGASNEGVRLALYFQRVAPGMDDVTQILADKALTQVVKTALRLPDAFSLMEIDKQIDILNSQIDLNDFNNPRKLDSFIKRYSALWDADNISTSRSPVLNLYVQDSNKGISESVLASLSGLKRGL